MTTKITIDGVQSMAIVDTGACISLMSAGCLEQIRKKKEKLIKMWNGGNIRAAEGATLRAIGCARVEVTIGGVTKEVEMMVAESLVYDVILGNDALAAFNAVIDVKNEKMSINGLEVKVHTRRATRRSDAPVAAIGGHTTPLVLREDVTLQPRESRRLLVQTASGEGGCGDIGVIEEFKFKNKNDKQRVPRGMGKINGDGTTFIIVDNFGHKPIKLRKGTIVATWCEIDYNDKSENERFASTVQPANPLQLPTSLEELRKEVDRAVRDANALHTDQERQRLRELLLARRAVLSQQLGKGGEAKMPLEHKIELMPGARPANPRPFRTSPDEDKLIHKHVESLLAADIIEKSYGPWGAPVVLTKKKGTTEKRFCVDYRHLNNVTIKDAYPMPLIDDALDKLRNEKIFTTMCLVQGFLNKNIRKMDSEITAF
jgi:hypothetical protein